MLKCIKITVVIAFSTYILTNICSSLIADEIPVVHSSRNILVISSWDKDNPWQKSIEKGFKKNLRNFSEDILFYFEYLDAVRFQEGHQGMILGDFLKSKYQNIKVDVVVVEGIPAANFLSNNAVFFSSAKHIYINPGINFFDSGNLINGENIVIPVVSDIKASILEMFRLSRAKNIFILGESYSFNSKIKMDEAIDAINDITTIKKYSTVKVNYLVNFSIDKLSEKTASLPENSAIFYMPIMQSPSGERFIPRKIIKELARTANAPVFSNWSVLMGTGILGGYMLSGERIGTIAAEAMANMLTGKNNVVIDDNGYGFYYDWRQLEKWHINTNDLPENATILYQEPIFFEKYLVEIILILIALIALLGLSIVLFVVNRKLQWAMTSLEDQHRLLESRVVERTKELNEARLKAEEMARIDPLTGLNNRRSFYEQGARVNELSCRYGNTYSILMLDIDRFKSINDTYGHPIGDRVIKILADTLIKMLRSTDISGRLGGEEFAIILPETPYVQGVFLAERLRDNISKLTVSHDKGELSFTVSIGISEYIETDDTVSAPLSRADLALYKAKESGRNKVMTYHQASVAGH